MKLRMCTLNERASCTVQVADRFILCHLQRWLTPPAPAGPDRRGAAGMGAKPDNKGHTTSDPHQSS